MLNSYEMDLAAQQLLTSLVVLNSDKQGYTLEHGLIKYQGHVWIGANSVLQTKLITAFHDTTVGRHSGIRATY